MTVLWQGLKVTFGFFLIAGLLFASGVFTMLLYAKFTGENANMLAIDHKMTLITGIETPVSSTSPSLSKKLPSSAKLDAPIVLQHPELPAGCEITSLTMLLQFAGLSKNKMQLVAEMTRDETKIILNEDGSPKYWGNPNVGFVGDISRKGRGFGIYHAGLFPLLKAYIPKAVDLTNKPFDQYEKQIAEGIPVLVWTTIDFSVPTNWVKWDTDSGPIQTTFAEHAVLLVGYDEHSVFINDPRTGEKGFSVDKAKFMDSWIAMGNQGLSYTQ
jgi:uncharacterized protein YvpB